MNTEEKYWSLIEKGNVDSLSQQEIDFIKTNFSFEEFTSDLEFNQMIEEDQNMEHSSRKGAILTYAKTNSPSKILPVISGLVAGIVLMIGIGYFFQFESGKNIVNQVEYLTDTLYVETLVYDTIILPSDTIEVIKYNTRQNSNVASISPSLPPQNYGAVNVPVATIDPKLMENKGTSGVSNAFLLPETHNSSYFSPE